MRRLSKRFIVRISPDELDQAKAVAKGLEMNFSRFVRMALRERAALEAALREGDERGGTDGQMTSTSMWTRTVTT